MMGMWILVIRMLVLVSVTDSVGEYKDGGYGCSLDVCNGEDGGYGCCNGCCGGVGNGCSGGV